MDYFNIVRIISIVLAVSDLAIFVPGYVVRKYDHSSRRVMLRWKIVAMLTAVIILFIGVVYRFSSGTGAFYEMMLLVGMTVCLLGDIILEIRFLAGGVIFFVGHILYVLAVADLLKHVTVTAVITYVTVSLVSGLITVKKLSAKYRKPLLLYDLLVCMTFSAGIELICMFSPCETVLGAGMCLLVVSDWLLYRNKAYGSDFKRSLIAIYPYFLGQLLVALSVLI